VCVWLCSPGSLMACLLMLRMSSRDRPCNVHLHGETKRDLAPCDRQVFVWNARACRHVRTRQSRHTHILGVCAQDSLDIHTSLACAHKTVSTYTHPWRVRTRQSRHTHILGVCARTRWTDRGYPAHAHHAGVPADVGQVRARVALRARRELLEIHVIAHLNALQVDLEERRARLLIGH
jgi:hypothetical protein